MKDKDWSVVLILIVAIAVSQIPFNKMFPRHYLVSWQAVANDGRIEHGNITSWTRNKDLDWMNLIYKCASDTDTNLSPSKVTITGVAELDN